MQLKGLVNFKWENFLLIIIFVRRLYDQQNFVMHKHGKLQIRSTGCLLRGVKYEFGFVKGNTKKWGGEIGSRSILMYEDVVGGKRGKLISGAAVLC